MTTQHLPTYAEATNTQPTPILTTTLLFSFIQDASSTHQRYIGRQLSSHKEATLIFANTTIEDLIVPQIKRASERLGLESSGPSYHQVAYTLVLRVASGDGLVVGKRNWRETRDLIVMQRARGTAGDGVELVIAVAPVVEGLSTWQKVMGAVLKGKRKWWRWSLPAALA